VAKREINYATYLLRLDISIIHPGEHLSKDQDLSLRFEAVGMTWWLAAVLLRSRGPGKNGDGQVADVFSQGFLLIKTSQRFA